MIYLIEPYNAYQKPPKKKHWQQIAEEEALLVKIQLEEAARQKVIQDAQRQEAIRQIMVERDAAAKSNLNNQNIALPQYEPQPAAQQVQDGQYAAPAGGGGWVVPTVAERTELGDFILSPSIGVGPLLVSFTNTTPTPGNDTFKWIFGSGSLTSSAINPPPLVYTQTGSYVVQLYAISQAGNTSTSSHTVTVSDPTIYAWYTPPQSRTGIAPYSASFNLSSTGTAPLSTVTGSIDFGDGSPVLPWTASAMTVNHIYNTGSYTASFSVTESSYGHKSFVKLYVSASIGAPNPRFSATSASNVAPLSVSFANTSYPNTNVNDVLTYVWVFGDGTTYTGATPPVHVYDTGSFTVRLDASSSFYGTVASFTLVGGVTASLPTLSPMFTALAGSGPAPFSTSFNNASTNTVAVGDSFSYKWVFGDGTADSTLFSPGHIYLITGSYVPRLDMSESRYNVTNSYVYPGTIDATLPTLTAGFTLNSSSAGAGPDYEPMTASVTSSIYYNGSGSLQSTLSFISESVVIESFYNFTNATTYITAAGVFTASMMVTESAYSITSSYDIPFVVLT